MATTLKDSLIHWRRKLEKHNTDEDVILSVIGKVSKVPVTFEILQETRIGKCFRNLAKRPDIVGETAKAALKNWARSFSNVEQSATRNSKPTNVSKKENINKESSLVKSKHDVSREKTHQKEASHEHKHKHKKSTNLVSHSSSQQSSNKKYVVDCADVNSSESSPSLYSYERKETFSSTKCLDYDPNTDVSEAYNPECPELYPGSNKYVSTKTKKSLTNSVTETYEPSSLKRKLDEGTESKNKYKKTESRSKPDSTCATGDKLSHSKKEKHTHKDKNNDRKSESSNKEGFSEKLKNGHSVSKSSVESSSKRLVRKDSLANSSKSSKSKGKLKINCTEEFTSSQGLFEDCLGFNDIVTVKKKKIAKPSSVSSPNNKKPPSVSSPNNKKPLSNSNKKTMNGSSIIEMRIPKEESSRKDKSLSVPKPSAKLDEVDIVSTLPEIQPNYRPLPYRNLEPSPSKKKVLTNEEAIKFTSSRKEKTAVYSGRRSYYAEAPPSLAECCIRILIENIDAIEYMGEVPYFLIKPVFERCTPQQLFNIEKYNPYLVEETTELWKQHCKREFKLLQREENETWRELYLRGLDEQAKRLKSVRESINASMCKSGQARQVKLAYVDSVAKPPRDVARRQAKHGTALPVSHPVKAGPPSKASPKPVAPVINSAASSFSSAPIVPKKPKVAPLMAKTLKSMKMCFRR